MIVDLVLAGLLGLGLGILTGMPLGVINVAIIDAAAAGHRRAAIGIGIGGACADTIHAALAFVGVGRLITARPELLRVLAVAAAALIVGYAMLAWRRGSAKHVDVTSPRAVATGFLLTLPNPGALSAWVAIAASLMPAAQVAEAIVLALCVGIGSAAWFSVLAVLVSKIPREHRLLRLMPKAALIALVVIAAIGIVRVL